MLVWLQKNMEINYPWLPNAPFILHVNTTLKPTIHFMYGSQRPLIFLWETVTWILLKKHQRTTRSEKRTLPCGTIQYNFANTVRMQQEPPVHDPAQRKLSPVLLRHLYDYRDSFPKTILFNLKMVRNGNESQGCWRINTSRQSILRIALT